MELVGATGFEPATPCAQGRCATRLRYAPTGSQFTIEIMERRLLLVLILVLGTGCEI